MPYINTRDRFIHYENSPEVNLNKLEVYPVFADFNTISELSEGLQTVQLRVKGRDPKKEIERSIALCKSSAFSFL